MVSRQRETKESPWAEASGTPVGEPDPPTDVIATTAHESLQVSWNAVGEDDDGGSDITGYKVSWSSGAPLGSTTVGADQTTYTIPDLVNGLNYRVTVQAVNAEGESEEPEGNLTATDEVADGSPNAVPAAPRNVQAGPPPLTLPNGDPNPAHAGTTLLVTWDLPADNTTDDANGYTAQTRTSAYTDADGEDQPATDWTILNNRIGEY